MSVNNIFDSFSLFVMRKYRALCSDNSFKHYRKLFKRHGIECKKLSRDQKKAVDAVWKGCGKYDYKTHRLVYSVTGRFDPRIMPEKLFRTKIEMDLNNQMFKNCWSDKSYFSWWFSNELFPENIVVNINSVFYDNEYNVISKGKALELISEHKNAIIKPSLDSGFGRGVSMIDDCKLLEKVASTLDEYNKNFVVQKVFKQHELLSSFNPSSVNVIRYISLFLDGEVYPVMCALRCGAQGAVSDNSITEDGLGMFVIGIDENGVLKDEAFHSCGKRIEKCPNGAEFALKAIPGFEKMKEIIKQYHSKLPYFGFVAWDFVVDTDGEPRIMEYNIKGPGMLYYQYVNGPLMGEYTDLIVKRFKTK